MSVVKKDGKWQVLIDGETVFEGSRRDCKRYRPEVEQIGDTVTYVDVDAIDTRIVSIDESGEVRLELDATDTVIEKPKPKTKAKPKSKAK